MLNICTHTPTTVISDLPHLKVASSDLSTRPRRCLFAVSHPSRIDLHRGFLRIDSHCNFLKSHSHQTSGCFTERPKPTFDKTCVRGSSVRFTFPSSGSHRFASLQLHISIQRLHDDDERLRHETQVSQRPLQASGYVSFASSLSLEFGLLQWV